MPRARFTTPILPIALSLAGFLLAARPAPLEAAPRLEMSEREHDWGSVAKGKIATYSFTFRNAGDAKLTISEVESSCECTVPTLSRKELAPGEQGQIDVTFDTARFSGEVTKDLTIYSNDPREPAIGIRLMAVIVPGVAVEPPALDLGVVPRGGGKSARLRLSASDQTPFRVTGLTTGLAFLHAKVAGASAQPAAAATVEVTVGDGATPGPFTDFLQITTSHPRADTIRVAVKGEVEGLFRLDPPGLKLGATQAKEQSLGEVQITYLGPGSAKFVEASSSTPALRAELVPHSGGKGASVRIFLTREAQAGRLSGTITVRTDNAEQPSLPIRVTGFLRS